jgi:hypothetical protein
MAKLPAVGLLVVQGLLKLIGSDPLLFQEEFTDADGHED